MKKLWTALCVAPLLLASATALAQTHSDKQTKEDIERHRAMAAAHEAAAKCLEGGKGEAVCMKELQAACKNLAIGKYCNMKKTHKCTPILPAPRCRLIFSLIERRARPCTVCFPAPMPFATRLALG